MSTNTSVYSFSDLSNGHITLIPQYPYGTTQKIYYVYCDHCGKVTSTFFPYSPMLCFKCKVELGRKEGEKCG